uniref:E3 ubiquitin-protein ligase UPL6-like isoform X2 n=1 Tax=Rhizophora mucronata TaxID=61149 RepID=A0A2P2KLV0_RHIMU
MWLFHASIISLQRTTEGSTIDDTYGIKLSIGSFFGSCNCIPRSQTSMGL